MAKERILLHSAVAMVEVRYLGADDDKGPADRGFYMVTSDDKGYRIGEVGPFDRQSEAITAKDDFVKMVRSLLVTKH
jgi:hypothetical protein